MAPVQNKELIFPDVKMLTLKQIIKVLDNQDKIELWLKALNAYAFSLLEAGQQVPGYELAKKRAHRRWAHEPDVVAAFADLGDEIYTLSLKSPAQLEKLVGKARKPEVSKLTEIPEAGYTMKKSKI